MELRSNEPTGPIEKRWEKHKEANKLVAQYDQLMIVPVPEGRSPTPIAMLMPQADQVWINYVNTWITLKQEQGFFDELGRKWQLIGETG